MTVLELVAKQPEALYKLLPAMGKGVGIANKACQIHVEFFLTYHTHIVSSCC